MSMDDSTIAVEYRSIPNFNAYRVGDDGSVWTQINRGSRRIEEGRWHQLSPGATKFGHLYVNLHNGTGKKTRRYIHHLVLEAFVSERPVGKECCHGDGEPTNNKRDNLRWDTVQANRKDARKHGTMYSGERHHWARLTDEQIASIIIMRERGMTLSSIALEAGVSMSHVGLVCSGKRRNPKECV